MVINIEWSCLLMMSYTVFCVGFRPIVDPIVSVSSNLTPESASRYQLEIPVVSDMPHSHSATAVLPSIDETIYHTPTDENLPDLTVNNNNLVSNTQHNVSLVMPCIFNCFREFKNWKPVIDRKFHTYSSTGKMNRNLLHMYLEVFMKQCHFSVRHRMMT